jgi:hypothetical protein
MNIEESTEYESFIGCKNEVDAPTSLSGFLGEEEPTEEWKKHWIGMPSFIQEDNPPFKKLIISFRSEKDYEEFAILVDQKLTMKTKSVWYPKLDREENALLRWMEDES